jgi:hypothetical protein
VVPRRIKWIGSRSCTAGVGARVAIRSTSQRAAVGAIASTGWRIVVSATSGEPAIGMSSKPMTDSCSGTTSPRRRAASSTPIAIVSLAVTIAVSPGCGASIAIALE